MPILTLFELGWQSSKLGNFYAKDNKQPLYDLISGLLRDDYQKEVIDFLEDADIEGLDPKDPLYPRSLIVADVGESNIIQNNRP